VLKLVASSIDWLFAATTDGVFVSQTQADRWRALDIGLPHTLTGYGVLLDNVTATSLAIIDEQGSQHILGAVFNSEGVWRLVLVEESMLQPLPPQSPPKAVLIVGPVDPPDHTSTLSFIEWSERLADVMEVHGMNVVRVYWPDSTWENVRAAISGASVVVYKGHGFGLGDIPEDPTDMVGGRNGFCLVNPENPMGARLATQDMLVATSQLANDAVTFFFCCYCAGSSSSDPKPVSEALARRRIEAYSSTSLYMGGGAYFSGVDEESLLADLLDHPDKTLGNLYKNVGGEPDHTYSHILWPNVAVWFDGDVEHGWGRAFVGDTSLTLRQVFGYDLPRLAVSPTRVFFLKEPTDPDTDAHTIDITNGGGGILRWQAEKSDTTWLGISPCSGSAPGSLTISINKAGLSEGTYTGTVTISGEGAVYQSPQSVTVILYVGPVSRAYLPLILKSH